VPIPPTGGDSTSPQVAAAVARIQQALADLKAAQQKGDFAGQGKALEDLQKAIDAFNAATAAASASPSASPAPSTSPATALSTPEPAPSIPTDPAQVR
jgi:hypothetical protein